MAFDPVIVSATDGPLPETVEQMQALKAQGATSIDVQLTNVGMLGDAELLELVELEIRDQAERNGLTIGSITRDGSTAGTGIYGPPS